MDNPAPSAEDVVEALHQTMRALRAAHHRTGEGELTHMDGRVLGFFAHHPGATQKDLGQHSGRDKGQLARLVQGLRARGLLAATPDPADRRHLRIALTPAGQGALLAEVREYKLLRATETRMSSSSVPFHSSVFGAMPSFSQAFQRCRPSNT